MIRRLYRTPMAAGRPHASHCSPPCCQQYGLPAFARREHCVPFFVVAWHWPEATAFDEVTGRVEPAAGTAGVTVALRLGGLQTLHGPKRFDASPSAIGIWLRERYRQLAVWYLAPVFVT